MKKILFVASITRHILAFHIPYLKMFSDAGFEVHVASKGEEEIPYCEEHFEIEFERSPFKISNIKAYKELKKIIDEGNYDIIECNTPVASVLTRMATKKTRKQNNTRVIYIAHGFHFYKGAPLMNWLTFYPVEKHLSKYTDDLITINEEDFEFAKNKMKAKRVHHIHGIGVNEDKFSKEVSVAERKELREKLKLHDNDFVLFFAGELNKNKNQIMLIETMRDLVKENPRIKLLLAGDGVLKEHYENKIREYKLEENVHLLGYRNDVPEILKAVDLYVSASKREGFGINLVEAQISGVPVIASKNRGHKEIIKDHRNGLLFSINSVSELLIDIRTIKDNEKFRQSIISAARKSVKAFYIANTLEEFRKIIGGDLWKK